MKTKQNVTLIAHTPDPEKVIAGAAKLCYSPSSIDELYNNLDEEKSKAFIKKLMELGHESPIEHISFTFGIEGISRSLTHQLVRHRIASFSQQSQRYVTEDQFEYVIPPAIEKFGLEGMYIRSMDEAQMSYNVILHHLINGYADEFIKEKELGVYKELDRDTHSVASSAIKRDKMFELMEEKYKKELSDIEKKAAEDARYVLPNACETKIIMTMNARSLLNLFELRCCRRAQWEINKLAWQMRNLVMDIAPSIFKYSGPSCLYGKCREKGMTCGVPYNKDGANE